MAYTIKEISSVLNGESYIADPAALIVHLLIDSRKLVFPSSSLFFALSSERKRGAEFIPELFERGVRNFVVNRGFQVDKFKGANFIIVEDVLQALQSLSAYHRSYFNYPVIGITGSNGKTIVKEWLYQLLHNDFSIVRSPKSYNSQIGVPLSVWQMTQANTLGIFEAGISQPNEMEALEDIIKPTIGVITNIGEAHNEGFADQFEKLKEKTRLFRNCKKLIYCPEALSSASLTSPELRNLFSADIDLFSWSRIASANLMIINEQVVANTTLIKAVKRSTNKEINITVPFLDRISVDNAITCWCILITQGYEQAVINQRMMQLTAIEMRMEMKKAVNNCTVINDSYSNDLSSLEIALNYLKQQGGKKSTAILSDIVESGLTTADLYNSIVNHAINRNVNSLFLIGPLLHNERINKSVNTNPNVNTSLKIESYPSTEAFLEHANTHQFREEVILLKGARKFEFERISQWLEERVHQTVMEINLNAMVHNLKEYQKHLRPTTKVMAMVKAFSYGSGSAEVAAILQFNKVDYLAVAYADEGVELRKAGIHMPIMVMNPETVTFASLVQYDLEPEVYSFNILNAFDNYLAKQGLLGFPVHLKIDTGMHRLGFETEQFAELLEILTQKRRLIIKSVFSHLVASDNPQLDQYTHQQFQQFNTVCEKISKTIGYSFLKHLSNSAAIFRHPAFQLDMVRLGIGLYGVDSAGLHQLQLQPVATLSSTIAQIRKVKAGESVGYSRKGVVTEDSIIATIRLGYADGFSRRLSNGVGSVYVKGALAPVIGNVCMDMTMINITGIENVNEGDKVEIFGGNLPVQKVAEWVETIPYEIMTGISQRVKRIYYEE